MNQIIQMENQAIVRQIYLKKDRYKLGRDPESDIVFNVPRVSRNHAEIFRHKQDYYIIDNDSANHVYVNESRVEKIKLKSRDKINLSKDVTLFFLGEDNEEDLERGNNTGLFDENDFFPLKEVIKQVISLRHLDNILKIILDEVIALVGAERGFIVLTDKQGNIILNSGIAKNIILDKDNTNESIFSGSTVSQVIETKEKIFIKIEDHNEEDLSKSILSLELQSIMCAPLIFQDSLKGVLYVDSGYIISDFNDVDQFFFSMLADLAAIAIENSRKFSRMEMSVHELEEEIDNSEERFRNTLEASPDPIIIFNLSDNCLIQANNAFCDIFECLEADVLGKDLSEFMSHEQINYITGIVLKEKEIKGFESSLTSNNGVIFHALISGRFIRILDENCIVIIYSNIREQKIQEDFFI